MSPLSIFISYSHENEELKNQLLKFLYVLKNKYSIDVWHDSRICIGTDWEGQIDQAMAKTQIAILLVTTEFLVSEYILEREVPCLLARHKRNELVVVPVIATDCPWKKVPWLSKMQVWPGDRPVWGFESKVDRELLTSLVDQIDEIAQSRFNVGTLTDTHSRTRQTEKPNSADNQHTYSGTASTHLETRQDSQDDEAAPQTPINGKTPDVETVLIPAGEFWMGDSSGHSHSNERPAHLVSLPAYRIGKYPVTNEQYHAFVQDTRHRVPAHWTGGKIPVGYERHPVTNVSMTDADVFCNWLSEKSKNLYRLPTEEEWEKAARGPASDSGSKGRQYPWGYDWSGGCCNTQEARCRTTTPVTKYDATGASPLDVMDLSGNVWEWTSTIYGRYKESSYESPYYGKHQVVRGGSWCHDRLAARIARRGHYEPGAERAYLGFRIVVQN